MSEYQRQCVAIIIAIFAVNPAPRFLGEGFCAIHRLAHLSGLETVSNKNEEKYLWQYQPN